MPLRAPSQGLEGYRIPGRRVRAKALVGNFTAAFLGFGLLLSSPPAELRNLLQVPLVGSYQLSLFELALIPICLGIFLRRKLHIEKHEQPLFLSVALLFGTRVLSLLLARNVVPEQAFSTFRYVETFVVLLVMAALFSDSTRRAFFFKGVVAGVILESLAGFWSFLASGGIQRGFWLGVDNFRLQVYLLIICSLLLLTNKRQWKPLAYSLALLLALLATQTRAVVPLLTVVLILGVLLWGRRYIRPVLIYCGWILFVVPAALVLFPELTQQTHVRVQQVFKQESAIKHRLVLIEMAGIAFFENPVTGIGSGGFARQQITLYRKAQQTIPWDYRTLNPVGAHNLILGTAAETGSVGLLAYFLWMLAVIRICLRATRLSMRRMAEKSALYTAGAALTVIGLTLSDWWGQSSFTLIATFLLAFVLGWMRENKVLLAREEAHTSSRRVARFG